MKALERGAEGANCAWERTLRHMLAEGREAHARAVEGLAGPSRSSEMLAAMERVRTRSAKKAVKSATPTP